MKYEIPAKAQASQVKSKAVRRQSCGEDVGAVMGRWEITWALQRRLINMESWEG